MDHLFSAVHSVGDVERRLRQLRCRPLAKPLEGATPALDGDTTTTRWRQNEKRFSVEGRFYTAPPFPAAPSGARVFLRTPACTPDSTPPCSANAIYRHPQRHPTPFAATRHPTLFTATLNANQRHLPPTQRHLPPGLLEVLGLALRSVVARVIKPFVAP